MPWFARAATATLIALALAAGVVACGGDDDSSSDGSAATSAAKGPLAGKRVAYVTFGNASLYQVAAGEWFKRFAKEQGADKAVVIDGKFDPAVQQKGVDDLLASGIDGIIWQPTDTKAAVPSIKAAKAQNVPVVTVGVTPDDASPVPSVTFNDTELATDAGRHAAEWVKKNKPGEKAKLVEFDIPASELCRVWRLDAFEKGVREVMGDDNVEIAFRDLVVHDRNTTRAKMEDLLQAGTDFNVFTACGADGAVGGMQALVAAGRGKAKNNVPQTEYVFSIDGTPSELEYLLDPSSSLVETVALTPKENTKVALDVLGKIISGDTPADSDEVTIAPGKVLPNDDCDGVNTLIRDEYGVASDYKDIDCSKFG